MKFLANKEEKNAQKIRENVEVHTKSAYVIYEWPLLGKTSEKRNFTWCWRQYSHAFFLEFRTDQENENDAYGYRVISVLYNESQLEF